MAVPPAPFGGPALSRRWLILAALFLPLLGVAIFVATFDVDALRPRVATAITAATGRAVTLGRIGLALTPGPTVTVENAVLANAPGGSRPDMLRVARAEAMIALWPLLAGRVELRRLILQAPELLLETDAERRPNWRFQPPSRPGASEAPQVARETARQLGILVDRLTITDGRVTWRDGRAGTETSVDVARFSATPRGDAELDLAAALSVRGVSVRLSGVSGDLGRMAAAGPTTPWPFRLTAESEFASVEAGGTVAAPMQGRGWQGTARLTVPALERLAAQFPGRALPPLRDVTVRAAAADVGDGDPSLGSFLLTVGSSDLGALRPGLWLDRLSVSVEGKAPFQVDATGRLGTLPLTLQGRVAPDFAAEGQPSRVDVRVVAAGGELAIAGTVAEPLTLRGVDVGLTFRADPVPGWLGVGDIAGTARIALPGPLLAGGATLSALAVQSAAGDVAGEIRLEPGAGLAIGATLTSRRLTITALRQTATPTSTPGAASPPNATPATARPARLIPDTALPLDLLRQGTLRLRWAIAELVANATLRDVTIEAAVADGRGQFGAGLPAGRLQATVIVDAAAQPPRLHATASGQGADAAVLLTLAGAPGAATGPLDIDLDLRGEGMGWRSLAATAAGHVGLALVDGRIDAALLRGLPTELRGLLLPPGSLTGNALPLRCGALRGNVADGTARVQTLLLELPIGRLGGDGTLNLADETLALRLLPDLRLGPVQLRAPVRVAGTLAAPRVAVSPEAAIAGGIGALLSLQRSPDRALQELAGSLGTAPVLPDCAAALAVSRGGRMGRQPTGITAQAAPIPQVTRELEGPAPPAVQQLLRGLLGR